MDIVLAVAAVVGGLVLLEWGAERFTRAIGALARRLRGSDVDDRRLDVLAIEDVPLSRLMLAALLIFLRRQPRVGGVRVYHARRLAIHVERPLDVSLDGEITGHVPGHFVLAGEALRVVTGPRFVDVDDPEGVVIRTEHTR